MAAIQDAHDSLRAARSKAQEELARLPATVTAKQRARQRNGLLAPGARDFRCRRAGRAYNLVAEDGKMELLDKTCYVLRFR